MALSTIVLNEGLGILRNYTNRAATVGRGLDAEWQTSPRRAGESVRIRVRPTFVERDVATDLAASGLVTQDITESYVTVTVDQEKYVQVKITSKEAALMLDMKNVEAVRNDILIPQIIPLVDGIESRLQALYKKVNNFVGTAATTPSTLADIANVGAKMTKNKAPSFPNRLLDLDPDAYAKLWPLVSALRSANPTNEALQRAYIATVGGFDTYQSQAVPTHTAGVPGGTPTATGTALASTVAIAAGGSAGTYKEGDLITIAGNATQFVVTEDLTLGTGGSAGVGTLKIFPALPAGFSPSGALVTLVASHVANMGYTRDAFVLAMARLDAPLAGAMGAEANDPDTGFALRAVYDWDGNANVINVGVLYGVKCVRPELACRLLG
jgi:hypothetical protein